MSFNLNENNIVDYLFEDIPSDDNSLTDIDDFYDQDYLPPQQKAMEVVECSSSDDENEESNELVDILCLNDGNLLTLPSPKKTRSSLKSNSNVFLNNAETSTVNQKNQNKKRIYRALFSPPTTTENNNSKNTTPIIDEIITETVEFEFIPPNWSKNITSITPLPDFESSVGPSDSVDTFQCHTPFTIFNYLFSDEIMNMLVEQTNLYSFQRSQKTGKLYTQTNIQEVKTFFGINLLMGIKRMPSYRDYWSSHLDLHDSYISGLMTVNRFGWLLSTLHINNNVMMPK